MNAKYKVVLDHIAKHHSKAIAPFNDVLDDCHARHFDTVLVTLALGELYGIPHAEAKGIVLSHPICGTHRKEWRATLERFERDVLDEDGK